MFDTPFKIYGNYITHHHKTHKVKWNWKLKENCKRGMLSFSLTLQHIFKMSTGTLWDGQSSCDVVWWSNSCVEMAFPASRFALLMFPLHLHSKDSAHKRLLFISAAHKPSLHPFCFFVVAHSRVAECLAYLNEELFCHISVSQKAALFFKGFI